MVADSTASTGTEHTPIPLAMERRKRARLPAEWPLRLWREHIQVLATRTINVSSDGFYCLSDQLFSRGERLVGMLEMPAWGRDSESQKLVLRCDVLVTRVDVPLPNGACGIACQILAYSVLSSGSNIGLSADSTN